MERTQNSNTQIANRKRNLCICDFYAPKTQIHILGARLFLGFHVQSNGPSVAELS